MTSFGLPMLPRSSPLMTHLVVGYFLLIGDDQLVEFFRVGAGFFISFAGATATANSNESVVDDHILALVSQRLVAEETFVGGVARFLLGDNFFIDLGEVLGRIFLEGGEAGLAAKLDLTTFVDMDKGAPMEPRALPATAQELMG